MNAEAFLKRHLGSDELPDTYSCAQVVEMIDLALQESSDKRSDFDERRIKGLLGTLKKIEDTSKDTVSILTARRARINEEDE
ncbi:hypothetical protein ACYSUW_15635 [Pseudomonas frederiksbergensis]